MGIMSEMAAEETPAPVETPAVRTLIDSMPQHLATVRELLAEYRRVMEPIVKAAQLNRPGTGDPGQRAVDRMADLIPRVESTIEAVERLHDQAQG